MIDNLELVYSYLNTFYMFLTLLSNLILTIDILFAQRPEGIPYDTGPVEFLSSPFNIIVFIVLPILLILFYIWWIRKKKQEAKEEEEERKKNE